MESSWNEKIDRLVDSCQPAQVIKFIRDGQLTEDLTFSVKSYIIIPIIGVTTALLDGHLIEPDLTANDFQSGLARLWQAIIEERDTSQLSATEQAIDLLFAEELDHVQTQGEGLLAILQVYAHEPSGPPTQVNDLIQQACFQASSNLPQAKRLLAQAGAAIFMGAPHWPFWRHEFETRELRDWLTIIFTTKDFLTDQSRFPLLPLAEERQRFLQLKSNPPETPKFKKDLTDLNDLEDEPLPGVDEPLRKILLCNKDSLSPRQIDSVSPLTPKVIKQLITVLQDDYLAQEESPGQGYAPVHAAFLLGKSQSAAAVEPLIETLIDCDSDDILYSKILFALKDLGPLALPLMLDTMRYSSDPEFKGTLAPTLGQVGRNDERAFLTLEAYYHSVTWEEDRMLAVFGLAEQADPRVVSLFYKTLKSDRDITPEGIREIIGALEELDPALTKSAARQLKEQALQRYDTQWVRFDSQGQAFCKDCGSVMQHDWIGNWEHVEPETAPASAPASAPPLPRRGYMPEPALPNFDARFAKAGRNDPCPCGSGKKFKHCHGANKPVVN
jgi:hypothetical protein